uniref:G-protein coupled receptors family 3 profile domain-containing protein n=1 Tax=Plectus sambesii TaxID=2011161 RepID=A0A914WPZ2_9BILA
MCISMSGTVALWCFFAPKAYIVLFQPYKNVRNRQSAVGRLVNQQMRFISHLATATHQPLGGTISNPLTSNYTPLRMSADYSQVHNPTSEHNSTAVVEVDGNSTTTAASVHHSRSRAQSKVSHISQPSLPEEAEDGNFDPSNDDESAPFINELTSDEKTCERQNFANDEQTVVSPVTHDEVVTVDTVLVAEDDRAEVELILTEIVAQKGTYL